VAAEVDHRGPHSVAHMGDADQSIVTHTGNRDPFFSSSSLPTVLLLLLVFFFFHHHHHARLNQLKVAMTKKALNRQAIIGGLAQTKRK
jgi:hypothetical protein